MTPLRQTMIKAMCQHGFSPRTQHSYLYVVTALARYYRRSPDQLKVEDLQVYFNYLVQERSLSPASCRVYLHGIRFLYLHILPKGFMRTRHFGYLSNRTRRRKLAVILHCLSQPPKPAVTLASPASQRCWPCPQCDDGLVRMVRQTPRFRTTMVPTG